MFEASTIDVSEVAENVIAIDFGASNTDAAAVINRELRVWSERRKGMPSIQSVHSILAANGLSLFDLSSLPQQEGTIISFLMKSKGLPLSRLASLRQLGAVGRRWPLGHGGCRRKKCLWSVRGRELPWWRPATLYIST